MLTRPSRDQAESGRRIKRRDLGAARAVESPRYRAESVERKGVAGPMLTARMAEARCSGEPFSLARFALPGAGLIVAATLARLSAELWP